MAIQVFSGDPCNLTIIFDTTTSYLYNKHLAQVSQHGFHPYPIYAEV